MLSVGWRWRIILLGISVDVPLGCLLLHDQKVQDDLIQRLSGLLVDHQLGQVMPHLAVQLVLNLVDGVGRELIGLLEGLDAGDVVLKLLDKVDEASV